MVVKRQQPDPEPATLENDALDLAQLLFDIYQDDKVNKELSKNQEDLNA